MIASRRNHFPASPFEPVGGNGRAGRMGRRIGVAATGPAHGSAFKNVRPASTMPVVPAPTRPEWNVEIKAEALIEK